MKKKGISKLTKLKIIFYSFLILPFIVVACSIITHFVGNVAKYWLNFIIANYLSLMIFFVLVILSALILIETNGKQRIIIIIIMIAGTLISGVLFYNLAFPLDRDLYAMITKSYSEVNGPIVATKVKHSKSSTDTEVIIHDTEKNQNITITFLDQYSSSIFKIGDNIKVKYLPHSFMGIIYSNS